MSVSIVHYRGRSRRRPVGYDEGIWKQVSYTFYFKKLISIKVCFKKINYQKIFLIFQIFDEKLPKRPWDNFHFVEFYKVTAGAKQPDLSFAVQSLLEIPDQFKQIKALGLLNFLDWISAQSFFFTYDALVYRIFFYF